GRKEVVSPRAAGDLWYSSFDEYQRLTEPSFDNNTVVNNTVQLGGTAFLHCRVRNLGERTVSTEPIAHKVPHMGGFFHRVTIIPTVLIVSTCIQFFINVNTY
ncbi:hypothetical protein AAG570_009923, partial [Ranatra chinensis]